ncbi:MAG: LysM peptidoglycan-binding domain-containing protein [Candidatus Promineifilaceae bacterium]
MVSRNRYLRIIFRAVVLGAFLLVLSACQSGEKEATPVPTDTAEAESANDVETPTLAPTQTPAEATEAPEETATSEPSPTSPVPTPTAPLTPTPEPTATPAPTPVPDPTFHTVVSGDTLLGIADTYDVSVDDLLYANGYADQSEAVLAIGSQLQIPLCDVYQVASGNTISGIAATCGVSLDDLVTANIQALAPLGTVDSVPVGFILVIPPPSNPDAAPACTVQPGREQVIEYIPGPGEGINCLAQIYSLTTTTIIQANVQRLTGDNVYGQTALLIPPSNGAVLEITQEDIDNGATLAEIADWYEIPVESILDWNGNPVSEPLTEGQQLFIPGANLVFGVFQSTAPATPTPEATATSEATTTPES